MSLYLLQCYSQFRAGAAAGCCYLLRCCRHMSRSLGVKCNVCKHLNSTPSDLNYTTHDCPHLRPCAPQSCRSGANDYIASRRNEQPI